MTFRLLTVCTGNICRSPQAEQLLRAGFSQRRPAQSDVAVTFSSAGTMALEGHPMPPEAAALSREFGGDPDHHAGRLLTREIVDESDLILTMAREHRGAVAKLVPAASRKTFTLLEFGRILEGLVASGEALPARGDLPGWLARASERRGYFSASSEADDVIDPYRRSEATYRRSAEQIVPAVATIVRTLI